MVIYVVEDEQKSLQQIRKLLGEVCPEAEIHAFTSPQEALNTVRKTGCDVAFLDIELKEKLSGLDVAEGLMGVNPKVNIIVVTAFESYAKTAIQLRVSGFLSKPVTKEAIQCEMQHLRYPLSAQEAADSKLHITCFGMFNASFGGKPLAFERSKTREFLAYLIHKRGGYVTSGELRAVLWESAALEKTTNNYFQQIKRDLRQALAAVGMEHAFIHSWNSYAIDMDSVECDYYAYLSGDEKARNAYHGEYMSQYEWAEERNTMLLKQMHQRETKE